MAKRYKRKKSQSGGAVASTDQVLSRFFLFQKDVSNLKVFIMLAVVALVLFYQSLDNPIVFDTAQRFSAFVLNNYYENFHILSHRSLANISFGLIYKIAAADWFWHRLVNVIIHVTNSFLVFQVLKMLFFDVIKKDESDAMGVHLSWLAFLGSLFFLVNPVGLYGTAYLIQRAGQLGVLFSLLGILAYYRGMTEKQWGWKLVAAGMYFLALHSKELMVMFPAVVFLIVIMKEGPSVKNFLKQHGWVFVLFSVIGLQLALDFSDKVSTVYEPHGAQMIRSANIREAVLSDNNAFIFSIITQMEMYFRYIYLWFVPDLRNIFIDIHLPFATEYLSFPGTLYVVLYLVYPFLGLWLLLKPGVKKLVGLAMLTPWVFGLTEMLLVRLSEQFVLYRAYVWMILAGAVFPFLFSLKYKGKSLPNLKVGLAVVYICILTFAANDRMQSFESKTTLWRDVVNKVQHQDNKALYKAYRPYNNLAFALTSSGKLVESIPYYYQALQINPKYVKARSNLGAVLTNRGRFQEAIEHFRKAVTLDPDYVDAHVGLGVCAAEQGFHEEAIEHYRNALKAKADYPDALFNMGNAYLKLKQFQTAANFYSKAIKQKPGFADSHHNLGIAYSNIGNIREAQKAFEAAVKINPGHKKSREALRIIRNRVFGAQGGS